MLRFARNDTTARGSERQSLNTRNMLAFDRFVSTNMVGAAMRGGGGNDAAKPCAALQPRDVDRRADDRVSPGHAEAARRRLLLVRRGRRTLRSSASGTRCRRKIAPVRRCPVCRVQARMWAHHAIAPTAAVASAMIQLAPRSNKTPQTQVSDPQSTMNTADPSRFITIFLQAQAAVMPRLRVAIRAIENPQARSSTCSDAKPGPARSGSRVRGTRRPDSARRPEVAPGRRQNNMSHGAVSFRSKFVFRQAVNCPQVRSQGNRM